MKVVAGTCKRVCRFILGPVLTNHNHLDSKPWLNLHSHHAISIGTDQIGKKRWCGIKPPLVASQGWRGLLALRVQRVTTIIASI